MADAEKTYWRSLEELVEPAAAASRARDEFAEPLPDDGAPGAAAMEQDRFTRRSFIQTLGLSSSALVAACSRRPVEKVIPYLAKPEELTPGRPLYYASLCAGCAAGCGILVKTRDGRPIKIEGNPDDPVSQGAVCAVGQASVLSLYDADRLRQPTVDGHPATLAAVDASVRAGLEAARAAGRAIWLCAGPAAARSPGTREVLAAFRAAHPGTRLDIHDPLGSRAIVEAHRATHDRAAIPGYRFDRADVIASFGADFLGSWLAPALFTRQYANARRLPPGEPATARAARMSRHYQIESMLTLTGSNADRRIVIAPDRERAVLVELLRLVALATGWADPSLPVFRTGDLGDPASAALPVLATELVTHAPRALVVSGSTDVRAQMLVNAINGALGAYGTTLDLEAPFLAEPEGAAPLEALLASAERGEVGAIIFLGTNPVYDHPGGAALERLLGRVPLTAAISDSLDETARAVRYVVPAHHALEGWDDLSAGAERFGLRQPAVGPLYATRAAQDSLLAWAGLSGTYYDRLRARWQREVAPCAAKRSSSEALPFASFWDAAVEAGGIDLVHDAATVEPPPPAFRRGPLFEALAAESPSPPLDPGELHLVRYAPVALRDGRLANNGWLQEMPDPISKLTWGNAAALSPARASALGLGDGDLCEVTAGDRRLRLPVLVQPGQHDDVVAIALGYGRSAAGRLGNGVGVNAFGLAAPRVHLRAAGGTRPLARTQHHASMEGRAIVREATLAEFRHAPDLDKRGPERRSPRLSLYPRHEHPGHRWGMAIDLAACTGCGACIVSCQAENNVPVVGEDEVRRFRDMAWMRVDRYYAGTPDAPEVVHQPMLCLHCDEAPCEGVCPVYATVHSSEGLNQQVYNRCVGTRYCANACPAKTRRFNWFANRHDDPIANMVLNPDVVVRSRGVMEKCSLCTQRISAGKTEAARRGTPLADGDIRTACEQSCPAAAIVFGDLNDPKSHVARLAADGRTYRVFDDLGLGEAVTYLAKIRNPSQGEEG
jgi:MoCo/4Fe-4S cofactor protein with predicted Tat translocation signal